MSLSSHGDFPNPNQQPGMDHRLQEARSYYAEEHSEVSVVILHMSELLSSFVREDAPEKKAEWSRALANVRNGMTIHPAHEELRFITDFSIMLEEGLQCIADKCAKLEKAVETAAANNYALVANGEEAARKLKRQHDAKVQLVSCDLCGSAIPRLHYYKHFRQEHPAEFEKIAKFRCEYCTSAVFIKEPALRAHLEVCEQRLEQERTATRMPHPHQLICQMCRLQCATLKELATHAEKAHPHCQILTCTGCAALFSQPEQVVEHWRVAKQKFKQTRCAIGAPAHLVTRNKLIAQILARAKANGFDKTCASLACMSQNVVCQECGVICETFLTLYNHIHRMHNKVVQGLLSFGCAGCHNTYRCAPALKEHLLRSEIEGHAKCRNAGAAYWNEQRISKDLRPKEGEEEEKKEGDKADETMMTAVEKEDGGVKKEEETAVNVEDDAKKAENERAAGGGGSVRMEEDEEPENNKKITLKLKRTPAGIEIDAGNDSTNDMPSLEQFEAIL